MRNAVILGSGRSGTSMLAGVLAARGWFAGEDPYPAREANPKGFFEARDVNGTNEFLLARALPRGCDPGAWRRWLAVLEPGASFEVSAESRARMRRLVARAPFAFKDPRFCYTLPAWRAELGDAALMCVFRDPAATAASIVKECGDADYLRELSMDHERALAVWTAMYRNVLEVHRRQGDWLFLHFDQVLTSAGLDRVERHVGAPVARDFPDASLRRSRAVLPIPAETAAIYGELCKLAGHAPAEVETARTLVAVPATPAAAREPGLPVLSVILCTYNRRETLRESLATFARQSAPAGSYEVVVVDDGSSDGTARLLAESQFPMPVTVLRQPNGGLAAARNAGIAAARGRLLLLVNDDTLAFPDLVERHLAAHAARPHDTLAVLGSFEQPARALDNALMRHLEGSTEVFCYAGMRSGELYDWNRFWTCNVSVSREAVLAAGGFDVSFRRYGCEDTDLAFRLHERGCRVLFDATARAHHRHVLDLDALARRQRTVAQAWVSLFRKHPRALEHADWSWVRDLTLSACERFVDERLPDLPHLEDAARQLAAIDLHAFDGGHSALRGAEGAIRGRLARLIEELNAIWWRQGFAAGLAEIGAQGFAELLADEPWPLATDAAARWLAWPRWDGDDLDFLLREFAPAMIGRDDVCLCLRVDPERDGPTTQAALALQHAYARRFADEPLNVLLVDDRLSPSDVARLGRSVAGALLLPSSSDADRVGFLDTLRAPRCEGGLQLEARLTRAHAPIR